MNKAIYVVLNRGKIIKAFESSMAASRFISEKEFLDEDGIYKIERVNFIKRGEDSIDWIKNETK